MSTQIEHRLEQAADEIERLRAELKRIAEWAEEACDVIVKGVSLMTVEQLQQWEGCRAVVETCPSLPPESQEDRQRWIPVTEKLPEIDNDRDGYSEWVLAYDGTIECACYDPASGMWATSNEYLLHVTHWMPLPPPPTQEAQED